MRKVVAGLLGAAVVTSVGAMAPMMAVAAPPSDSAPAAPASESAHLDDHDMPNPLEEKRRALREQAVSAVVSGKAKVERVNRRRVVNLGKN